MKIKNHLMICLVLLLTIITACESPTNSEERSTLYGTWQLRIISGGFAGISDTIDISENNSVVSYKADRTANFYYNDSLVLSTPFTISKENTINSNGEKDVITYTKNGNKEVIFSLINGTLIVGENGVVDGFTRHYIRKP